MRAEIRLMRADLDALRAENVSGALEVPPAGTLVGLLKRAVPIVETFTLKAVADLVLADEFALRHNQEVSN